MLNKKIKFGDIFEIATPKGKAYLHYISKDKTLGDLIRVLPGLYKKQPDNLTELVTSQERYMIFFPLAAAYKKNIVKIIGYYSADAFEKPKFMRSDHYIRGEFLGWHIVNTETWQRQLVKQLNKEQTKMSPFEIWNDTLLIEKLNDDWKLEDWI